MKYKGIDQYRSKNSLFQQSFNSFANILVDGWSLNNSPVVYNGVELNGTDQYLSLLKVPYGLMGPDTITVRIIFRPDFLYSESADRYFFDSDVANHFGLYKSSAGNLIFDVGGGTIINAADTDYSSYWKTGGKNVLVISCTTGNNAMYLNGVQVKTSSTAWTASYATILELGREYSSSSYFDGKIYEMNVFRDLWLQDDVTNDYNSSLFNFESNAYLWCDFDKVKSVGSGNRAFDSSSRGYRVDLGDGAGSSEPIFLNPGLEYLTQNVYTKAHSIGSDVFVNNAVTTVHVFKPYFTVDDTLSKDGHLFTFDDASSNTIYRASSTANLVYRLGNTGLGTILKAEYEDFWNAYAENVLIISSESGNTRVFLNGEKIDTSVTSWIATTPTDLYIGNYSSGTNGIQGVHCHFSMYPNVISDVQVKYLTKKLLIRC